MSDYELKLLTSPSFLSSRSNILRLLTACWYKKMLM